MALITPAELEKELKSAITRNVYYIYGKDAGRVSALAELVRRKYLGKGYTASDYSKFSGDEMKVSAFLDTAEICPMFTDWNFVEVNDLNGESLNADDLKALTAFIADVPDQTVLLFSVTGFDVKGGKKVPTAKNKKIIDACTKAGSVSEADLRKPADMAGEIVKLASENGSSISKQNAEKLALICLGDTLRVTNEINKLSSYAGSDEITAEMIDEMVAVGIDTTAFAMASAVTSGNSKAAFTILDDLTSGKTEAVLIISALASAFMDLYRASAARASGVKEAEVEADFGYHGRGFVVRNAFRDAAKTSTAHLRKCLEILEKADLECKSTRLDQKIIIEQSVAQMLAAGNGA